MYLNASVYHAKLLTPIPPLSMYPLLLLLLHLYVSLLPPFLYFFLKGTSRRGEDGGALMLELASVAEGPPPLLHF